MIEAVIHTRRMPHSTQFHRIVRAPEHLYYALLLSTSQAYAGRPDPWRSWLRIGFALAVKEAPPGVAAADRLHRSVISEERRTLIRLSSAVPQVISTLHRLLAGIEGARPSVAGGEDAARLEALVQAPQVAAALVGPLSEALADAGLDLDEAGAFMSLSERALIALTDNDITSVELSSSPVRSP